MAKLNLILLVVVVCCSCSKPAPTLFNKLPATETGVDFVNHNNDTDSLSILDYLYYYNGAGVGAGDINNDGLPDIYFASNTEGNKLYLNKGNFKFEDITDKAGVKGNADWTTGVTMADVNADGFLDIYISTVSNHTSLDGNGTPHEYFKIHATSYSLTTATTHLQKVQSNGDLISKDIIHRLFSSTTIKMAILICSSCNILHTKHLLTFLLRCATTIVK